VLGANRELSGAEVELVALERRNERLRAALKAVDADYDFVLIDCPPSLSMLTLNGLCSAHGVIVPMQCEYFALEGLTDLVNTIKQVHANLNRDLQLIGLLRVMFDPRITLQTQVSDQLKAHFGDKVFDTVIPRNVRLAEAPSYGLPGVVFDPASKGRRPSCSSRARWWRGWPVNCRLTRRAAWPAAAPQRRPARSELARQQQAHVVGADVAGGHQAIDAGAVVDAQRQGPAGQGVVAQGDLRGHVEQRGVVLLVRVVRVVVRRVVQSVGQAEAAGHVDLQALPLHTGGPQAPACHQFVGVQQPVVVEGPELQAGEHRHATPFPQACTQPGLSSERRTTRPEM
jgi:hypothetical protein